LPGSATGRRGSLPDGDAAPLRETVFWSPAALQPAERGRRDQQLAIYGFVFDFCGIEIDRDTGEVCVDRYVSLHDAGRILNAALFDGQVRGAFAMAIGGALYERFIYDESGSFLTGSLLIMPYQTAGMVPICSCCTANALADHPARRQGGRGRKFDEHACMHRQCGRGRGRRWRFGASVDRAASLAAARGERASTASMKTEAPDTAAKSAPAKRRGGAKTGASPCLNPRDASQNPIPRRGDAKPAPPAPENSPARAQLRGASLGEIGRARRFFASRPMRRGSGSTSSSIGRRSTSSR